MTTDTVSQEALLTVKEVARYLRIAPSTVYKAVASGRLPHVRIGAAVRFEAEALRALVQRGGLPAEPAAGSSPRAHAPACSPTESEGKEA